MFKLPVQLLHALILSELTDIPSGLNLSTIKFMFSPLKSANIDLTYMNLISGGINKVRKLNFTSALASACGSFKFKKTKRLRF